MIQVSDCGVFFHTSENYNEVKPMHKPEGECTFCFNPSILRDENLNVEYCEFHAKVLLDIVEHESTEEPGE